MYLEMKSRYERVVKTGQQHSISKGVLNRVDEK